MLNLPFSLLCFLGLQAVKDTGKTPIFSTLSDQLGNERLQRSTEASRSIVRLILFVYRSGQSFLTIPMMWAHQTLTWTVLEFTILFFSFFK